MHKSPSSSQKFIQAVIKNDLMTVKEITINTHINIHANSDEAFKHACQYGYIDIVQFLFEFDIQQFFKNSVNKKSIPYHLKNMLEKGLEIAISHDQIKIVDYILFQSGLETFVGVRARIIPILDELSFHKNLTLASFLINYRSK